MSGIFRTSPKNPTRIINREGTTSTDLNSWTTVGTNTYSERRHEQLYICNIDLSGYAEGSIFVRAVATVFSDNVFHVLYSMLDLAATGDTWQFTQEEEKQLIEQIIFSIIANNSSVAVAEEMQGMKYLAVVKNLVNQTEQGVKTMYSDLDFTDLIKEIMNESHDLTATYIRDGSDAFYNGSMSIVGREPKNQDCERRRHLMPPL